MPRFAASSMVLMELPPGSAEHQVRQPGDQRRDVGAEHEDAEQHGGERPDRADELTELQLRDLGFQEQKHPDRRRQQPDHQVQHDDHPEMGRIDAELHRDRQKHGEEDQHHRHGVQDAPHDQEEDVYEQQEPEPVQLPGRQQHTQPLAQLLVGDDVLIEADDREHDHDRGREYGRVGEDLQDVAQPHRAVDEQRDDENVEDRQYRDLDQRHDAEDDAGEDDQRRQECEEGVPEKRLQRRPADLVPDHGVVPAAGHDADKHQDRKRVV